MAANVQNSNRGVLPASTQSSARPMNRDFQVRFTTAVLGLLTVAAMVLGSVNFQKERESQVPSDQVWWLEHNGKLTADRVEEGGAGAKAGIKAGDAVVAVNQQPITQIADLERQL